MLQNKNAWVFVVFEDVFTDANISSIRRRLGSKLMLIKSTLIKIFLIQHKLATIVRKNFWKMHVFQFYFILFYKLCHNTKKTLQIVTGNHNSFWPITVIPKGFSGIYGLIPPPPPLPPYQC